MKLVLGWDDYGLPELDGIKIHNLPPGPGSYVMSHVYQIFSKKSVLFLGIHGCFNSRVQEVGDSKSKIYQLTKDE